MTNYTTTLFKIWDLVTCLPWFDTSDNTDISWGSGYMDWRSFVISEIRDYRWDWGAEDICYFCEETETWVWSKALFCDFKEWSMYRRLLKTKNK